MDKVPVLQHRRITDMPEDHVTQKYCDMQHKTLNDRIDRIDSRLFWILTFMIIASIGIISNIFVSLSIKPPTQQVSGK